MKLYALPGGCPKAPDIAATPFAELERRKQAYEAAVAQLLRALGYTGPRTGKLVAFPVADSRAVYMVLEGGAGTRTFALADVYPDSGYQIPAAHLRGLRKQDILAEIARGETWAKLASAAAQSA